jgi:hypothetical protein
MSSNTISFQCLACDADFEVGITSLLERPVALKCPHCNARPPAHRCHALAQALDDLLSAMAAIRSKVHFELSLDTEELPPPYGAGAGAASSEGSLTSDEDEDEDEGGDEDEDEDEDFEFDDEDEEFEEDEDSDDE